MPVTPRWKPHVTVAAVVERQADGRREYLLVEEDTPEGRRFNNPAGHLEAGESPEEAVRREVLEEAARVFVPDRLVGVYLWRLRRPSDGDDITYLRFTYGGTAGERDPSLALDTGIVATHWMTLDAVRASRERHRSPLVLACIEDHAAGRRLPLDAVTTHASVWSAHEPPR